MCVHLEIVCREFLGRICAVLFLFDIEIAVTYDPSSPLMRDKSCW